MKELIAEMSLLELGINVTITGIVIVFAMLILLVGILILFGKISEAAQNASAKKAEKVRAAAIAAMATQDSDSVEEKTVAAVVQDSNGLSEEVVAVISAAVATMYMGSNKNPVIKAIKKSAGRRSAWANAGIADNTRAF